jgi:hypothetical protein
MWLDSNGFHPFCEKPPKGGKKLEKPKIGNGVQASTARLNIVVRDEKGKIIETLDHDSDLYLSQWQAIIASLLKNLGNATASGSGTFSCKDTSGTARTLGGVASSYNSPFFATALEGASGGVQVSIGTGTTAAAYSDYGLQTAISGATAYPSSITTSNPSGNILYVQFSVTITLSNAATVSEAIVTVVVLDSGGTQRTLAITHDVFTGVAVPANGSITLNYTLQYNSS